MIAIYRIGNIQRSDNGTTEVITDQRTTSRDDTTALGRVELVEYVVGVAQVKDAVILPFLECSVVVEDGNNASNLNRCKNRETRIVGPLSDTRTVESVEINDIPGTSQSRLTVTTKIEHGYFKGQYIAVINSGLSDEVNGTFKVDAIDELNPKVFTYIIPITAAGLGLVSGITYTTANGLGTNAVIQAEIDSVESASPYVFNCSIRSTWGQCGMWADGSKATGFKSMVVAQYTGVSLQKDDRAFIRYDRFTNTWNQASLTDAFATIPYHAKGDAYWKDCLLYTSPSPRDGLLSRMPSSA